MDTNQRWVHNIELERLILVIKLACLLLIRTIFKALKLCYLLRVQNVATRNRPPPEKWISCLLYLSLDLIDRRLFREIKGLLYLLINGIYLLFYRGILRFIFCHKLERSTLVLRVLSVLG